MKKIMNHLFIITLLTLNNLLASSDTTEILALTTTTSILTSQIQEELDTTTTSINIITSTTTSYETTTSIKTTSQAIPTTHVITTTNTTELSDISNTNVILFNINEFDKNPLYLYPKLILFSILLIIDLINLINFILIVKNNKFKITTNYSEQYSKLKLKIKRYFILLLITILNCLIATSLNIIVYQNLLFKIIIETLNINYLLFLIIILLLIQKKFNFFFVLLLNLLVFSVLPVIILLQELTNVLPNVLHYLKISLYSILLLLSLFSMVKISIKKRFIRLRIVNDYHFELNILLNDIKIILNNRLNRIFLFSFFFFILLKSILNVLLFLNFIHILVISLTIEKLMLIFDGFLLLSVYLFFHLFLLNFLRQLKFILTTSSVGGDDDDEQINAKSDNESTNLDINDRSHLSRKISYDTSSNNQQNQNFFNLDNSDFMQNYEAFYSPNRKSFEFPSQLSTFRNSKRKRNKQKELKEQQDDSAQELSTKSNPTDNDIVYSSTQLFKPIKNDNSL